MTAAEAQQWITGLKHVTGCDWVHRIDHKDRDEFRTIVDGFEMHLWSTGRWAIYELNGGNALLRPGNRSFQEALDELKQAHHEICTR